MAPLAALAAALLLAAPTAAQELPLKREIPGVDPFECPSSPTPVQPDPTERSQARQLASSASQELILGNRERARDFLARANQLDPASAGHAYQHARVLEDLGESEVAVAEYCRALGLNLDGPDAEDARARVEALTEAARPAIPVGAVSAFRTGLSRTDAGRLAQAAASFGQAREAAPEWPEAHYNHGVVLARLGRRNPARQALRRYLELEPDAPDAIAVSERIGELQVVAPANLPSPGVALAVGLIPGMGQIYTGRPATGLGFLGVGGGAAAAGLLYDRGVQPSFEPVGLAIAGATTALAALDGFLHARRMGSGPSADPPDAGAALALGLVPGLGQVYAGRTDVGLAFVSMVAAATTASDLLETGAERRFAPQGLVVAGALTGIGALEAFVTADLHQRGEPDPPNPWTALGLGVIPGMGQFYEGRTAMGMTVLSLSAGFTTAGLVYRIGRGVTFRDQGLAIGAGILGLGAIEAFIWAARHQEDGPASGAEGPPGLGAPTLQGPALLAAGRTVDMRLLGFRF